MNKFFEKMNLELLTEQENINENMKIEEMATLRKNRSGLPVNIYLNDTGSWAQSGHWKRIKFQPDKSDRAITRNMVPMSIDDDPKILIKNPQLSLDSKEIEQVKNFVKNNKELLLQLCDQEIDIIEFFEKMIK
jgi:hypothetical protein